MAGVAEVGGAEAEEDGDGAAVAALVLQVVGPVLRTHLGRKHFDKMVVINHFSDSVFLTPVLFLFLSIRHSTEYSAEIIPIPNESLFLLSRVIMKRISS